MSFIAAISHMFLAACLLSSLPLGLSAQSAPKVVLAGTLYNVDADAPSPSARINLRLLPLKEHNANDNAGPCPNLRYEPTGPTFKLVTDARGEFAVRVPVGQYFAVVTSATESFDLVSACVTVAGPEDAKSCAARPLEKDSSQPLQHMIVRYSNRLKVYHGDILMSHPCAQRAAAVCDSLHETRPLVLAGRHILLQYGGRPLPKTAIAANRGGAMVSFTSDARGIVDAGLLYSLAEGATSAAVLTIPVAGEPAKIHVQIAPEPAMARQTLSLFQRKKCGWEAEVIN